MDIVKQYIESEQLNLKRKTNSLVFKRYYLYAYLRYTYNLPLVKIGKMFNRDHATIIHGIKIYEQIKETRYFQDFIHETKIQFPMGVMVNSNFSLSMFETLSTLDKFALEKKL
jgi:chromosomal replication initiation ATPase DnaA